MSQNYFIGVDVSKETLDFALVTEGKIIAHSIIGNKIKEIRKFLRQWSNQFSFHEQQVHFCMEHTGVYTYPLLTFLQSTSYKVCVESPYNIKHSQGLQRGKSDKIDAERIALFAWKNSSTLQEWKESNPQIKRLKYLITMRKGLINARKKIIQSFKESGHYMDKSLAKELEKSCSRSVAELKKDILAIEQKMLVLIESDNALLNLYKILISVDGIGSITALLLIASTNGFANFTDAKKFACYAGVVPFENRSGISIRGKSKVSHFANKDIKTALHLCAITLIKNKGEMGDYYRRKIAEGKNKMCVINALRNKIVLRVFACVKANKLYVKQHENIAA